MLNPTIFVEEVKSRHPNNEGAFYWVTVAQPNSDLTTDYCTDVVFDIHYGATDLLQSARHCAWRKAELLAVYKIYAKYTEGRC